jgi:hypothetical protein
MTIALERRLRRLRSRVWVRSWDYRQRRHARGVWYRLRRLLADASAVYAVSRPEAELLIAEGCRAEPVGLELEPSKIIVFAPAARVTRIASARPLAVRLGADLLGTECLALVPFEHGPSGPG